MHDPGSYSYPSYIAVLDRETAYTTHLVEYLRDAGLPFEIRAFLDPEAFLAKADPARVAVLVAAESSYTAEVAEIHLPRTLLLSESGRILTGGVCLSKYQRMDRIRDSLRGLCEKALAEGAMTGRASPRSGAALTVIGIYTPITRCLQTSLGLTLGQMLAEKSPTLYLNLEPWSGMEFLLSEHFRNTIGDLLYFNEVGRERAAEQIPMMVHKLGELDYLPPMRSFTELRVVEAAQWTRLIETIEAASSYRFLILDLSEMVDGLFDILRSCSEIITIIRPENPTSEAKMLQYQAILQEMGYEDIYARARRYAMPIFHALPDPGNCVSHTEFCRMLTPLVRRLTQEMGSGGGSGGGPEPEGPREPWETLRPPGPDRDRSGFGNEG